MSDEGASVLLLIDKVPFDDKAACTIFLLIYFKVDRIVGQEEFHDIRPFDEAVVPAVKILLYAYVEDLCYLLDAVEVEVIDRLTLAIGIFVDQ